MSLGSSDQKIPRIKVEGVMIISLIYNVIAFFDPMKFFDLRDPFLALELSLTNPKILGAYFDLGGQTETIV